MASCVCLNHAGTKNLPLVPFVLQPSPDHGLNFDRSVFFLFVFPTVAMSLSALIGIFGFSKVIIDCFVEGYTLMKLPWNKFLVGSKISRHLGTTLVVSIVPVNLISVIGTRPFFIDIRNV